MSKRPSWDQYFLNIALAVAARSTCLRRRYGAVIVLDNVIISTGYNGAQRAAPNCIDRGVCKRQELNVPPGERYELCEAVHAEMNAVINAPPAQMKNATIYIRGFHVETETPAVSKPCLLCSRIIKNSQIARVVTTDEQGNILETAL